MNQENFIEELRNRKSELLNEVIPFFRAHNRERGKYAFSRWKNRFFSFLKESAPSEAFRFKSATTHYMLIAKRNEHPFDEFMREDGENCIAFIDDLIDAASKGRVELIQPLSEQDKAELKSRFITQNESSIAGAISEKKSKPQSQADSIVTDEPSASSETPTLSSPENESVWQNFGRKEIRAIIGGGVLSLFSALVVSALQIAGIISMGVAHLLLILAWFVVVIGVFTSELLFSASRRRTIVVVTSTAIIAGIFLFQVDSWMVNKRLEIDKKADAKQTSLVVSSIQKMSDAELKSEVTAFVKSLHEFDQRMRATEPDLYHQKLEELRAAKTEEEKRKVTERYFELEGRMRRSWMEQRENEYNQRYYTRAEELRDEMYRRIPPKNLDRTRTVIYKGLGGPQPIREIASDLERLGNLLP